MSTHDPAERWLQQLENARVPQQKSKEAIWQQIEARTQQTGKNKPRHLYTFMAAAAGLALLLGLAWFWFRPAAVSIAVPVAQQQVHKLPDGSSVHLNAASELRYNPRRFAGQRKLALQGEAFFDVAPGKPFIVEADALKIEVTGTKFNAYAREGNLSVSCYEGGVEVSYPQAQTLQLSGGEKARVQNARLVRAHTQEDARPPWLDGLFRYHKAPLSEVWQEIGRQFGMDVNFQGNAGRSYTGSFSNHSLSKALNAVCKPMGLQYTIHPQKNSIVIY